MRRALVVMAMAGICVAATPKPFGGWAVVTFRDVPEYLEVGTPVTLAFKIRQHGRTLRYDLSPSLSLRDADAGWVSKLFSRNNVPTRLTAPDGFYEATVTPSDTGRFVVLVHTDIAQWTTRTLPIRVVTAGTTPPPLAPIDRGRQLFAAKGCVTCHAKRDDPALADMPMVQVGPPLTGRVFDASWLALKLADPASYRMTVMPDAEMPNLGLRPPEIAALVPYLNGETVSAHLTPDGQLGARALR